MSTVAVAVVALGVRSQDEEPGKDSAGDQMRLAREAALAQPGRFLYAEHVDHGSGFRGNRGKETQAALDDAKRAASEHGRAELWVFKSERLARGSGRRDEARSVLEVYVEMRRAGVDLRSVEDDAYFTNPMLVGVADAMAHKYGEDLSAHVRRGLAERKAAGKPVGPLPLGYAVEVEVITGAAVASRVIDEDTAAVVQSIFEWIEHGASPGAIARRLNLAGIRTKRGKTWEARSVRRIAENPVFAGHGGYPAIVSAEQADRTRSAIARMDPAAVQQRKGGRAPDDDSFILRGIARCLVCDSALWTRRSPQTGKRSYVCRHRRQGTGACSAGPIPAQLIEEHALGHLTAFVGDAEVWALEQVREHEDAHTARQRALDLLREEAAELDRRRALVLADYTVAVTENDPKARWVLEAIDQLDGRATTLAPRITDAEAQLTEWHDTGEDEALAMLQGLLDLVQGRVSKADGTAALHDALASVLAGIWVRFDGDRLRAEFRMAEPAAGQVLNRQRIVHLFAHADAVGLDAERVTLRPTSPSTFV